MSHEDVVGVIYHVNFPYPTDPFYAQNPTDNNGRRGYYGVIAVPNVFVDGHTAGTSDAALLDAYNARKAVPTDLSLDIEGSWDEQTRAVDVTVTASTSSPLSAAYRLHIVLVENGIYYAGGNGLLWHDYVMRDMFPDFDGTPVVFSGDFPQTAQASANFILPTGPPPNEFVPENCQIVCFLQEVAGDRGLGEIHQAAAVSLLDLSTTDAAVLPAHFALEPSYPNPFNPRTTIPVSMEAAGAVRLEILDPQGRRVRILQDGPLDEGRTDFVWDGRDGEGRPLASGIYLARLTGATQSHSQRLVLIK